MANSGDMANPDDLFDFPVPSPTDRYSRQARRAATLYLAGQRLLLWAAGVWVVLIAVMAIADESSWVRGAAQWTSFLAAFVATGAMTRMFTTRRWMWSLRSAFGFTAIPRDVRTARYARTVLAGERAVGELETALLALWDSSDHERTEQAKRVLARRGVPDVSSSDYEVPDDTPFPAWHRHGVKAWQAPLPEPEHPCTAWTIAVLTHDEPEKTHVLLRCACGGHSYDGTAWDERNSRRHHASLNG